MKRQTARIQTSEQMKTDPTRGTTPKPVNIGTPTRPLWLTCFRENGRPRYRLHRSGIAVVLTKEEMRQLLEQMRPLWNEMQEAAEFERKPMPRAVPVLEAMRGQAVADGVDILPYPLVPPGIPGKERAPRSAYDPGARGEEHHP